MKTRAKSRMVGLGGAVGLLVGVAYYHTLKPHSTAIASPKPTPSITTTVHRVHTQYRLIERDIAWGKEVAGLQAGLSLDDGPRPYCIGDMIQYTLQIRNVSSRPIPLLYFEPSTLGWTPKVTDSTGNKMFIWIPAINQPVARAQPTLLPGEMLRIAHFRLGLRPPGWKGEPTNPILLAPIGNYRIIQNYRFGGYGSRTWRGELWTGQLDLHIIEKNAADGSSADEG